MAIISSGGPQIIVFRADVAEANPENCWVAVRRLEHLGGLGMLRKVTFLIVSDLGILLFSNSPRMNLVLRKSAEERGSGVTF